MARINPPTTEGKLWLQQFNNHLMMWVKSGLQDNTNLTKMGECLEKLFERCPDYAPTVQSVALSASFLARQGGIRPAAILLAKTGLTAALVRADGSGETARLAALQSLFLAEIYLAQGRRFDGLDALKQARKALEGTSDQESVATYARALGSQLEGALYEMGLEHEAAGDAYFEAAEQAQQVIDDQADEFATEILETVMGRDEMMAAMLPQLTPLVIKNITDAIVKSRLGLLRSAVAQVEGNVSVKETKEAARDAWKAVDTYGLPEDVDIIDLFPAIIPLTPTQAAGRVNKLLRIAKKERPEAFSDWDTILHAILAHRLSKAGDEKRAADIYEKTGKKADHASPLIAALAKGFDLMDNIDGAGELQDYLAEEFMFALAELRRNYGDDIPDLRLKALLDEPVSAAVHLAFNRFSESHSKDTRLQLGLLIDSLRQPRWLPLDLDTYEQETTTLFRACEAYQLTLDHLKRIVYEINNRPGTAAIVLQEGPKGTLFLCVTEDEALPIVGYLAQKTYRAASRQLAEVAIRSLAEDPGRGQLETAGKKLFKALPKAVQDIIQSSNTLLLAPDLRSDEDSVPFELMHDGDSFIGLSKMISRFASIRDIARAVEPRRPTRGKVRALVTCAGEVSGYPKLEFALQEQTALCELLADEGWDAPVIDPSRLTPSFFLDRLKYVSVLHIAAHGEVSTGNEAVLLPGNQRMVADDLLSKRFPGLPFVYLNTCLLAHTRYLGGGVSRGIAHTLFELGAPAVIANLSPVYDKVAFDLSQSFYRYALDRPVGEALRQARCELAEDGVPPALWGTTILIGDPEHMIAPIKDEGQPDAVIEMLDAYMSVEPDPDLDKRASAFERVRDGLLADPTNINIRYAAALAVVHVMSKLDYSVPESDEECVERLISVADELDHLPTMTLMRVVKANRLLETKPGEPETIAALDDVLPLLDALKDDSDEWDRLRQKILTDKKAIEMRALGMERLYQGSWSDDDKQAADAVLDILQATQAEQEVEAGAVTLRPEEVKLEDIAWNSIVIGYPNRFESMREQAAYAGQLAKKLVDRGLLPEEAGDAARVALAGLLHDLWGRQHSVGLEPELVQGWTGTVAVAIEDLSEKWSPPDEKPAFETVRGFTDKLEETLEFLDACKWEEVYKHMGKRFTELSEDAKSLLSEVQKNYPDELAGCYAWLLGSIVVRNTFSPLDGSVPEDIGEHMEQLASDLWAHGEGYLMNYLMKGFESVREAEWDELQRWKLNITPEKYQEIKSQSSK